MKGFMFCQERDLNPQLHWKPEVPSLRRESTLQSGALDHSAMLTTGIVELIHQSVYSSSRPANKIHTWILDSRSTKKSEVWLWGLGTFLFPAEFKEAKHISNGGWKSFLKVVRSGIWTHASMWRPEVPLIRKESTLESGALDRSAILTIGLLCSLYHEPPIWTDNQSLSRLFPSKLSTLAWAGPKLFPRIRTNLKSFFFYRIMTKVNNIQLQSVLSF